MKDVNNTDVKYINNTDVRPCIYTDKDGEHSVGFHCFNGNKAIIEFTNGKVREVPIDDIELLDSEHKLISISNFSSPENIKRYWGNEKCFEKYYENLKKGLPELFD